MFHYIPFPTFGCIAFKIHYTMNDYDYNHSLPYNHYMKEKKDAMWRAIMQDLIAKSWIISSLSLFLDLSLVLPKEKILAIGDDFLTKELITTFSFSISLFIFIVKIHAQFLMVQDLTLVFVCLFPPVLWFSLISIKVWQLHLIFFNNHEKIRSPVNRALQGGLLLHWFIVTGHLSIQVRSNESPSLGHRR